MTKNSIQINYLLKYLGYEPLHNLITHDIRNVDTTPTLKWKVHILMNEQ